MPQAASEARAEVVHEPSEVSLEEAAKLVGVTHYTIRRALKSGHIKRCNRATEAPRFKRETILDYIALRESGQLNNPQQDIEIAQAETITGLLAQAQTHAENFAEKASDLLDSTAKHVSIAVDAMRKENERLQKRIDSLEKSHDDVQAALDKLREEQYNIKIAEAEAEAKKLKTQHWISEARLFGPAILAKFFGGKIQETAFTRLIKDLSQPEIDAVMGSLAGGLTPDHMMTLMAIMGDQAEAREEAKAEPPKPTDQSV